MRFQLDHTGFPFTNQPTDNYYYGTISSAFRSTRYLSPNELSRLNSIEYRANRTTIDEFISILKKGFVSFNDDRKFVPSGAWREPEDWVGPVDEYVICNALVEGGILTLREANDLATSWGFERIVEFLGFNKTIRAYVARLLDQDLVQGVGSFVDKFSDKKWKYSINDIKQDLSILDTIYHDLQKEEQTNE